MYKLGGVADLTASNSLNKGRVQKHTLAIHAVLWIRIRMDLELLPNPDPELKFRIRIQQKVKEHINKTVNFGLFVLLDSSIE